MSKRMFYVVLFAIVVICSQVILIFNMLNDRNDSSTPAVLPAGNVTSSEENVVVESASVSGEGSDAQKPGSVEVTSELPVSDGASDVVSELPSEEIPEIEDKNGEVNYDRIGLIRDTYIDGLGKLPVSDNLEWTGDPEKDRMIVSYLYNAYLSDGDVSVENIKEYFFGGTSYKLLDMCVFGNLGEVGIEPLNSDYESIYPESIDVSKTSSGFSISVFQEGYDFPLEQIWISNGDGKVMESSDLNYIPLFELSDSFSINSLNDFYLESSDSKKAEIDAYYAWYASNK